MTADRPEAQEPEPGEVATQAVEAVQLGTELCGMDELRLGQCLAEGVAVGVVTSRWYRARIEAAKREGAREAYHAACTEFEKRTGKCFSCAHALTMHNSLSYCRTGECGCGTEHWPK